MKNPENDYEFRRRICDWLRANGINPGDVPVDVRPSVADGQMTLEMWVRTERGSMVRDPGHANRMQTQTVSVPVAVPPDGDVIEWLRQRCPTCGR